MKVHLRRHGRGFTLIEQAVALSVIALLMGSILVPLQTQIENRKIDETRRTIDLAQEMLLGFVVANGYFPCPADAGEQRKRSAGDESRHRKLPGFPRISSSGAARLQTDRRSGLRTGRLGTFVESDPLRGDESNDRRRAERPHAHERLAKHSPQWPW